MLSQTYLGSEIGACVVLADDFRTAILATALGMKEDRRLFFR